MTFQDTGYLNILVLDDDPDMRQLMSSVLIAAGHQVVAVETAERGLEQLPYYTFEVAFLDQNLPGMEGLVLGEYLRHNNPHMQVALVTGSSDPGVDRLAKEHGIRVIRKPFDVDELLEVVDRYVALEAERVAAARREVVGGRAVDVKAHLEALPAYFGAPNVPQRLEDLVARKVRVALERMRYDGAFDELDRAAAYAGLLTAQVLGLRLPRHKDGSTFFEDYDAIMRELGKDPAFS
ncbi:MAG: response regulator [Myxococcales bacterium]|nr:response regulator [Myxococcales bacterium]